MTGHQPPAMRVQAQAAPLGRMVEVFGFATVDPWDHAGDTHTGVIASVTPTGHAHLGTRITFADGRIVYTRDTTACWLVDGVLS